MASKKIKTITNGVHSNAAKVARIMAAKRKQRGWTQGQLAMRPHVNVKAHMISQIERTGATGRYGVAWPETLLIAAARDLGWSRYAPHLLHILDGNGNREGARLRRGLLTRYDRLVVDILTAGANLMLDPEKQPTEKEGTARLLRQAAAWRLRRLKETTERFAEAKHDLMSKGLSANEILGMRERLLERIEQAMLREDADAAAG